MTAQVAVLSTQGIALASDSAVTVTDRNKGTRSYPSANKIFPIPGAPVAVLHSGNAVVSGVQWQILVDAWAARREHVEHATIDEYADEFAAWLGKDPQVTATAEEESFLRWCYRDYLLSIRFSIRQKLQEKGSEVTARYTEQADEVAIVDGEVHSYAERLGSLDDFAGIDAAAADALVTRLHDGFKEDLDWVFDDTPRTKELDAQAEKIARLLVTKQEPFQTDATLVFAGYARDGYHPSLWRATFSGVVGGVARVRAKDTTRIHPGNQVTIVPLGITDAIDSFLRGSSWQYRQVAQDALDSLSTDLGVAQSEEKLKSAHESLTKQFDDLEWNQFLSPMLDVVETLPLTEMTRLADALVGLASLRQLITGDSTVGGPVDLVRITKNSGVEWVRRKLDVTSA